MPTVLVAYDVSRDDSRARVAAFLQVWGDRIQRSVFVCTLAADHLVDLVDRLHGIIDVRTDAVHVVPLCGACWEAITVLGQATVDPNQLFWSVFDVSAVDGAHGHKHLTKRTWVADHA